jgi:hypothetical protein
MRRTRIAITLATMVVVGTVVGAAVSATAARTQVMFPIKAAINGYQEVPPISTTGSGTFTATVDTGAQTIAYTLSYSGLSSPVSFAHIHFGQTSVNGGIVAFLCGGGGKPACPATSGSISGTITAADITAVATQGIAAGEFGEVVAAIGRRATYVNVHTANFPSGEMRGQVARP